MRRRWPPSSPPRSDRSQTAYDPSPPDAVQERGSQGCSAWTVGLGGASAALPVGAVVVVVLGATVLDVGLAGGAAGGWTEKSVPVTTDTCEPAGTWEGSYARMTAPDSESATDWAAASSLALAAE